ncbi:MAG TPA: polysaccharide deacetylase family protein [Bacteroidales bacterium]|nr:polysaccharide deacetylase family protein [Bacteroidales bacterium]
MRLYRPVFFAQCLYPEALFRIKTSEKSLYLTFDDGPDPDSTPGIILTLQKYGIKAVFFCNGKNAEQYPYLIEELKNAGHLVGNHGYGHPDGWKTKANEYVADVLRANAFTSANLFRPPYGRLTPSQYHRIKDHYRIVFWDIMPYDFDSSFGEENAVKVFRRNMRSGSIIVLHDKPNSAVKKITERIIISALREGYYFGDPFNMQETRLPR